VSALAALQNCPLNHDYVAMILKPHTATQVIRRRPPMMYRTVWIAAALFSLLINPAVVDADPIDFSALSGPDASDVNGQNFAWAFGGQSGTVNVRATWPDVLQIDGAMRTPVRPPASFANPFTGTVTLQFDAPVEIAIAATFPSMTRDGLDGGRFEQVRLSSAAGVQFQPLIGTTAVYSGAGTNVIVADDEFSPTPTLSNWGFVGAGPATTYELQYTGTTVGLSETFTISVIPEPRSALLLACALCTIAVVARRSVRAGWRPARLR
jgi:hypothetical protein